MTEANTLREAEGTTVGIYVARETPSRDYSEVLLPPFQLLMPCKKQGMLYIYIVFCLPCYCCNEIAKQYVRSFLILVLLKLEIVGNITSSTLILNTGAPQGCVLSPLLYSVHP